MVLLAGLFVVAFETDTMAQEKKEGKAGAEPEAKAKATDALPKCLEDLNLTAEQKTKIDGIVESYDPKVKEAKDTKEHHKIRHEELAEIYEVLNDTQKPKFVKEMHFKATAKKEVKKEAK